MDSGGAALPPGAALGRALSARALEAVEGPLEGSLGISVAFRADLVLPPRAGGLDPEFLLCVGVSTGQMFHTLEFSREEARGGGSGLGSAPERRREFSLSRQQLRAACLALDGNRNRQLRVAVAFLRPPARGPELTDGTSPRGEEGSPPCQLEVWDVSLSSATLRPPRGGAAARRQAEVRLLADSLVQSVAAENAALRQRLDSLSLETLEGGQPPPALPLVEEAAVAEGQHLPAYGTGGGAPLSNIDDSDAAALPRLAAAVQSLEDEVLAAEQAVPSLALLRAKAEALRLARAVGAADAWGQTELQGSREAAAAKARAGFEETKAKREVIYGHVLNALANVAQETRFLALRARLSDHVVEVSHQIARFEALSRALEGGGEAADGSLATSRRFREIRLNLASRLERLEADVEEAIADEDSSGNAERDWADQFQTLEDCRRSVAALQGNLKGGGGWGSSPWEGQNGPDEASNAAVAEALAPEVEAAVEAQMEVVREEGALLALQSGVEALTARLAACGLATSNGQDRLRLGRHLKALEGRVQALFYSGAPELSFRTWPAPDPPGIASP